MTQSPQTNPQGDTVTSTEKIPPPATTNSGNKVPVTFPVIVIEGMTTSDGRHIQPGALSHRALPLPILAQTQNPVGGSGHDGAYVVGQLETLERVDGTTVTSRETGQPFPEGSFVWRGTGWINPTLQGGNLVTGTFNTETNSWEGGVLVGNSADIYEVEAEVQQPQQETSQEAAAEQPQPAGEPIMTMTKGKIAATTLCPVPAFADAYVVVDGTDMIKPENRTDTPAGQTVQASAWRAQELGDDVCLPCAGIEQETITAAASTDNTVSLFRPTSWFTDPKLTQPTPLTITEDGHIYGHLAAWGTCHTGFAGQCVQPPRSSSDYSYFHVGVARTMDEHGTPKNMPVGHITMGEGGHAGMSLSATEAAAHYDNTNTVVADVTAGEDAFGIWINGATRRHITPEQLEALHASPLSGDWRSISGKLELVAALAVNTPGFPIPRARIASGIPMALTAAGALPAPTAEEAIKKLQEDVASLMQWKSTMEGKESTEEDGPTTEEPGKTNNENPPASKGSVKEKFSEFFEQVESFANAQAKEQLELRALSAEAELSGILEEVDAWIRDALHREGITEDSEDFAGKKKNWVDQEGGLPKYIKRVAKHLKQKGMDDSRAIATAVNVAKKMCASGDTNWPGKQNVNPGSRAEACAAVASWEAKKAASHTH